MSMVSRGRRPGFTLIELLVVIAIIAILIGLLLPAIQKVREAGNRSTCQNNLKQLALAVSTYHDARNRTPYDRSPEATGTTNGTWAMGGSNWSWLTYILPYVEQSNLYTQLNLDNNFTGTNYPPTLQNNVSFLSTQIPAFLCPSDIAMRGPRTNAADLGSNPIGQTNYKGVSGSNWG